MQAGSKLSLRKFSLYASLDDGMKQNQMQAASGALSCRSTQQASHCTFFFLSHLWFADHLLLVLDIMYRIRVPPSLEYRSVGKDEAQTAIRGVTLSGRSAPMNLNSLGIVIESERNSAAGSVQSVHSKALSEVNGDLEDNGHRNGDSVRIGPAAKPSTIPKSKLEQVQSEVMSVMPRWPSVLTAVREQILLV
jgi:hypothetical protein